MHTFVKSLESAREHSAAIAKHHDLFQVFHDVAVRYTELKAASTPAQPEQVEHRVAMDTYLSELGFQPQVGAAATRDGNQNGAGRSTEAAEAAYLPSALPSLEGSGGHEEAGQGAQLGNWYTVSQQMMGWLDNDVLPF